MRILDNHSMLLTLNCEGNDSDHLEAKLLFTRLVHKCHRKLISPDELEVGALLCQTDENQLILACAIIAPF